MNIPDKRVEEIVEKYKQLMACEVMTVWDEKTGDEVFLPDWLRTTLTQYHQDLMSEVVKKIEKKKNKGNNGEGLPYENSPEIYGNQRIEAYKNGYNQALTEAQTIIKLSK